MLQTQPNQPVSEVSAIVATSTDWAQDLSETPARSPDIAWLNSDTLLSLPINPIEDWNLPFWEEDSLSSYVSPESYATSNLLP